LIFILEKHGHCVVNLHPLDFKKENGHFFPAEKTPFQRDLRFHGLPKLRTPVLRSRLLLGFTKSPGTGSGGEPNDDPGKGRFEE